MPEIETGAVKMICEAFPRVNEPLMFREETMVTMDAAWTETLPTTLKFPDSTIELASFRE